MTLTFQAFAFRTLLMVLGLCACQRSDPKPESAPAKETELSVFAAASLREAFTGLGEAFRRTHPEAQVNFNFAGSQELRTQIEHGAAADVFASADQRQMQQLQAAGKVSGSALFARNEPIIVVATEQAASLLSLADLPRAARIVLGAPDVPIGRYTLQILDNATRSLGADFRGRVEAKVVSHELNVKQVLAKVSLGEADAGIVYRTDAAASQGKVSIVSIPADINVIAEYPIAIVTGGTHPTLAAAWVAFIQSKEGQALLEGAGFIAANGGVSPS